MFSLFLLSVTVLGCQQQQNYTCFTAEGLPTTLCEELDSNCTSGYRYAIQVVSVHGTTCHNWTWDCTPITQAPTSVPTHSPTNIPTHTPTTNAPTESPTPTPTEPPTDSPTMKKPVTIALFVVGFICFIVLCACCIHFTFNKKKNSKITPVNRSCSNNLYSIEP